LSARASPQTLLGKLTALPRPLAVFRGLLPKGEEKREEEMRGEERRGLVAGKGREGGRAEEWKKRGEEGMRRVEGRGGREFVLCPRKKKEKSAPMHASHSMMQCTATWSVSVCLSLRWAHR